MQYVQVILTDSQADLLGDVLGHVSRMENLVFPTEHAQLALLGEFFTAVAEQPDSFPVTDSGMRRSIKKRLAHFKGPAQPKPNKRKRAQLRAQGAQKRTRAEKRELALLFNQAREAALAVHELEQAQAERERVEGLGIVLPD